MKNITRVLMISFFGLSLMGCGSSDSKDVPIEDNTTINELVDYSIPLTYDYNKDGSSAQRLAPFYVNKYNEIQKKLNEKKGDSVEFYSILSGYIGALYLGTDSLSKLPSYAPSGKSKSQVVTVSNGQVDYSSYRLKGDIDFNWEVDFEDLKLLSEVILNDVDTFQYDINGDGKVDTADVIDLVARLGNEIKLFDFYTTSGTKLNLASRTVDEEKHFAYTGSETKIMIVAKDRNGASAYESGLSDITDVWYKQEGWKLENSIPKIPTDTLYTKENNTYNWNIEPTDRYSILPGTYLQSHPFLVGWEYNIISVRPFKSVDAFSLTSEPLSSFIKNIETNIENYFVKTDMGHKVKKHATKQIYYYNIGALIDEKYSHLQKITITSNYVRNGQVIELKNWYLWENDIYYSPKLYMLVGDLKKDDGTEVKGTVMGERIGPDKEDAVTGDIQNSSFGIDSASFGTYNLTYIDECTCTDDLGEYIFEEEGKTPEFKVSTNKVKVKLELTDKDGDPLGSKVVKIVAKGCVSSDANEKSFSSITDYHGNVDFSNVPVGDYMVYADGKEKSPIHVCEAYNGQLKSEKLWDIDMEFEAHPNANASYGTYKTKGEWHWKKVEFASIQDTLHTMSEVRSLYNLGEFYFPYEESGLKVLGHTTPYTNEHGIKMVYTSEGKYCMNDIQKLIKNHMADESGHPEIPEIANSLDLSYGVTDLVDNCTMRLTSQAAGAGAIYMGLSSSNVNNLVQHKTFTFKESRTWSNMEGTSTLTIKFTPSK